MGMLISTVVLEPKSDGEVQFFYVEFILIIFEWNGCLCPNAYVLYWALWRCRTYHPNFSPKIKIICSTTINYWDGPEGSFPVLKSTVSMPAFCTDSSLGLLVMYTYGPCSISPLIPFPKWWNCCAILSRIWIAPLISICQLSRIRIWKLYRDF